MALLVALALVTACTGADGGGSTRASTGGATTPEPAGVPELRSIEALQDRFEADAGTVRLILIISPT